MAAQRGKPFDFGLLRTVSVAGRRNLVSVRDLADPRSEPPAWNHPELPELAGRLSEAIRSGRCVLVSTGAHVIKAGLGPYLLQWLRRGWIHHIAGNGAVAIHDFELALIGGTSEDVADALERGIFGMWEETGRLMHRALAEGAGQGLGFGWSVGSFMEKHPELFPHREVSVLYHAYRLKVPCTIHVTIGADIVHQHPSCDFARVGEASGTDFKIYCSTVAGLEGGAFLNFGSAVTGPEVFLKALSIVRNAGFKVERFTTANFDIVPLGDYRNAVVDQDLKPAYFYRPWKNIVVRPTSLGGKGFHIEGEHKNTIPVLHKYLTEALAGR